MASQMEKLTITLPKGLVEAVKRAVAAGKAASTSSYIADAVQRRQEEDSLSQLVDELIAEHGEPSSEDYEWADRVLGAS